MLNRGSILFPILVVCLIFSTTLAAKYRESRLEMMINQNLLSQKKLFYMAEGGLVKGLWELNNDPDWDPGGDYFSLGGDKGFFLDIEERGEENYLISSGIKGGEKVVLTAKFRVYEKENKIELIWWKEGLP